MSKICRQFQDEYFADLPGRRDLKEESDRATRETRLRTDRARLQMWVGTIILLNNWKYIKKNPTEWHYVEFDY